MIFSRAITLLLLIFSPISGELLFAQYHPGQWIGEFYSMPVPRKSLLRGRASVLVDEHNNIQEIIESLSEANVPIEPTYGSHGLNTNHIIWNNLYNMMIVSPQWHDGAFYAVGCGVGIFSQPATMEQDMEYIKSHEVLTSQILDKPLSEEQTRSLFTRENGTRYNRWFFAKQEVKDTDSGKEWRYLGYYDVDLPSNRTISGLNIIPCDGDRFIVVSSALDLFDRDRQDRSPFCRMSVPIDGKNEFRITASIDHGQDMLRQHMSNPKVFGLAYAATENLVLTDKYATLVELTTGLYWVFSREKASLVKSGNIFKKVTAEHIISGGFSRAVFCVNPEKDGTVLISAEDEDYLISGKIDITKEFMELQRSGFFPSPEKAREWYSERQKENHERNPFLAWYRIYPESGKVEKLAIPPEGGSELKYIGDKPAKIWRPMPDGSVKLWNDIFSALNEKMDEWTVSHNN